MLLCKDLRAKRRYLGIRIASSHASFARYHHGGGHCELYNSHTNRQWRRLAPIVSNGLERVEKWSWLPITIWLKVQIDSNLKDANVATYSRINRGVLDTIDVR